MFKFFSAGDAAGNFFRGYALYVPYFGVLCPSSSVKTAGPDSGSGP